MIRTPPPSSERLPFSLSLGWGLGTLAFSAMFSANSVLLLTYMIDSVGIAAGVAGTLFGLSKLFDAAIDPVIGIASDRTESRWGRRRPFMLAGTLMGAASFALLFNVPAGLSGAGRTVFVGTALMANAAGYALFVIPYLAMPAEMAATRMQRTTLMSFRVAATSLGQIVGSVVGPMMVGRGGAMAGYATMGWALALFILVVGLACVVGTRRAGFTRRTSGHGVSFFRQVRLALDNRPFVVLMISKLTSLFYVSASTVITPFLFKQILARPLSLMATYFLVRSVVMLVTQPAWIAIVARWDRKPAYALACVLLGASSLFWLIGSPAMPVWAIMAQGVVAGFASGGVLLVSQALLPDVIEHDYRRTGLRREGAFASVYTIIERAAFALAAAVMGMVLGAMGYVAAKGGGVATQSAEALRGIQLCIAFPVAFLLASAVILSRWYRIDEPGDPARPRAARPGLDDPAGGDLAAAG